MYFSALRPFIAPRFGAFRVRHSTTNASGTDQPSIVITADEDHLSLLQKAVAKDMAPEEIKHDKLPFGILEVTKDLSRATVWTDSADNDIDRPLSEKSSENLRNLGWF